VTGKRAVTAILFVILLACGTPTGGCSCSPLTYQIHFVGFVTKNQAPVTGTRVTASVLDTDCQSTAGALAYLAPNGAVIDSTGHYGLNFRRGDQTLCALASLRVPERIARFATACVSRFHLSTPFASISPFVGNGPPHMRLKLPAPVRLL